VPRSVEGFFNIQEYRSCRLLLLKFRITWSASLILCSVVLWRARKPNWVVLSKFLLPKCFCTICRIIFSKWLPVEDKRLIGHKCWRTLESLLGFGKATTLASFEDAGKCESRMQWLIKWVNWTSGLLGKCLRHSFGIPSILQAFLNFNEFNIFCKSYGLTFSRGSLHSVLSRAWL
jgi:hypothetical protein